MIFKISSGTVGAFVGCAIGHYLIGGTIAVMICAGLGSVVGDLLSRKEGK